jgi:hypothetical protein
MLGFERFETAAVTVRGIELAAKIKKDQFNLRPLTGKPATAPELWAAVLAAYSRRRPLARPNIHLIKFAPEPGQALDEVRRELAREGADLKGAMWSLRGNTWNLSEERQEQRKNLCRQYTKLAAR